MSNRPNGRGGRGKGRARGLPHCSLLLPLNTLRGDPDYEGYVEYCQKTEGIEETFEPYYIRVHNHLISFFLGPTSPRIMLANCTNGSVIRLPGGRCVITMENGNVVELKCPTIVSCDELLLALDVREVSSPKLSSDHMDRFSRRIMEDIQAVDHLPEICQLTFSEWDNSHVLTFLKYIKLGYEETALDLYGSYFREAVITGSHISTWFLPQKDHLAPILQSLGVSDSFHQEVITAHFLGLEVDRDFNSTCTPHTFDITPFRVQEKVHKMFVKHSSKGRISDPQSSFKPFHEFLEYCGHFHNCALMEKTIRFILTKHERKKTGKKIYKVKFIITENVQDSRIKALRKVLGLPLSFANKVGITDIKFGMFHAAVAVGPLQMEWVDNSLVLIRSISSENVILCIDVGSTVIEDVVAFSKLITDHCRWWNRDFVYQTVSLAVKKKPFHANCQQFVELLISQVLKLRLEFSELIMKFLIRLKQHGDTRLHFEWDQEFVQFFPFLQSINSLSSQNQIVFQSHQQLDDFMYQLLQCNPAFPLKYPAQYELLKAFDRSFWLKHLNRIKTAPPNSEERLVFAPDERGCPFNPKRQRRRKRQQRNTNDTPSPPSKTVSAYPEMGTDPAVAATGADGLAGGPPTKVSSPYPDVTETGTETVGDDSHVVVESPVGSFDPSSGSPQIPSRQLKPVIDYLGLRDVSGMESPSVEEQTAIALSSYPMIFARRPPPPPRLPPPPPPDEEED